MNIILQFVVGVIGLGVVAGFLSLGIFLLHELDLVLRRMFRGR
jgi:hypothetical protein